MLCRETIAVCYDNHKKYTNTFSGQNAEFQCDEAGGIHTELMGFKGLIQYMSAPSVYLQFIIQSS
jgi:hypothetical protein